MNAKTRRNVGGPVLVLFLALGSCLLPMSEQDYMIEKYTKELKNFEWNEPPVADDAGNIFFRGTSSNFFRWSYESGLEEIGPFDGWVSALAVDNAGDALFVAESNRIWRYDISTGNRTLVFTETVRPPVEGLCVAEDYLIADCGTRPTHRLIRLSDYAEVDTIDWGDDAYSSVYAPSVDKRFMISGYGDELGYQAVDFGMENLGSFVKCHDADGFFYGPLKLFPDESRIATGTGDIYGTDVNMEHLLTSFDRSLIDLAFYQDRILLLGHGQEDWDDAELVALSLDTYEPIGDPVVFEHGYDEARNLFVAGRYLYVIREEWPSTYITRFDLEGGWPE